MTDNVLQSALARGKPVAAKRVQDLVNETAALRARLAAAELVAQHARKWAAHDGSLAYALQAYEEAKA